MSDNASFGFGKYVPGFDFLQGLASQAVKGASQSIPQLPNLGNWVAPTLNVEELEKRIDELKAVQFWLDQNAMALKATIQALEVQKMTLATLKGMNFNVGDIANAFKLKAAETVSETVKKAADVASEAAARVVPAPAPAADEPEEKPAPAKPKAAGSRGGKAAAKGGGAAAAAGVIDPMQWWGALSQQFQNIAASAVKDATRNTAIDATKNLATGLAKEAVRGVSGAAKSSAARKKPAARKAAKR